MPTQPRKRTAPKAAGGTVKAGQVVVVGKEPAAAAEVCLTCFPCGRLPDGVFSIGCAHGVWTAAEA